MTLNTGRTPTRRDFEDEAKRWKEVAAHAYWLLAWTYQSHCFDAPKRPFDMSVFAPEVYPMMNRSERLMYVALCDATGWPKPEEAP